MPKLILCLLILFLSSNVFAIGGTMVGNGGGFAEMQAVYIDQLLPTYLEKINRYDQFGDYLSSEDLEDFTFDEECPEVNEQYVKGNPSSIPSCLLYGEDLTKLGPQPKPIAEIAAVIFAYRWLSFRPSSFWNQTYQIGLALFTNIQLDKKATPLTWKSRLVGTITRWSIGSNLDSNLEDQITLELRDRSIDLKDKLMQTLGCSTDFDIDISYMNIKTISGEDFSSHGPIRWSCDYQDFRGELHMDVTEFSSGSSEDAKIELRIFKKRLIF